MKRIVTENVGASTAEAVAPAIALMVEGAIVAAVMQPSAEPADVARDAALTLAAKNPRPPT